MSQFLILIYEDESQYATADQSVLADVLSRHNAFGEKHGTQLRGGNALKPTATARTVRGDAVTDGPFLETKEALGGYYVVEADDLEQAVQIAKDCPAPFGCVEVREVMVFS